MSWCHGTDHKQCQPWMKIYFGWLIWVTPWSTAETGYIRRLRGLQCDLYFGLSTGMTRKMRRLFAGIAAEITIGAESRGRRGEGTNKRANTGHTRGGKEAAYQQWRRQHERWQARNQWLHMEVSHEGTPKSSKLGIETHGDLGIPHFKRPLYVHVYGNDI